MITSITPYLTFNSTCAEALNFYVKALGAEIKNIQKVSDGPKEYHSPEHMDKVMHAEVAVGKAMFMASDSMGYEMQSGNNTSLSLNFETIDEIEKAWKNMSDGAKIGMELQDTFWGAKFGQLHDKYGICWMFNCQKTK
jgi:PhnB protein